MEESCKLKIGGLAVVERGKTLGNHLPSVSESLGMGLFDEKRQFRYSSQVDTFVRGMTIKFLGVMQCCDVTKGRR
jgi:hypothetical protein